MVHKYSRVIVVVAIVLLLLGSFLFFASSRRHSGGLVSKNGSNKIANVTDNASVFSQDVSGLPEAKPTEKVSLHDGEVYDLAIEPVKKQINGIWVRMLGYNGSVPGPTITVPQGATVKINVINKGDIATTLHSHGVRMVNAFDGVPEVTQKPIAPGESFEYTLKFPDAGVFWYHPHIRTDYTIESGLYGNYIVTPQDTSFWSPVNTEIPITLDDIALDKDGLLPFSQATENHALMGRFGNVMLINGATQFDITAKKGEVMRLYLTNTANTRVMNFTIPGVKMKLVAADMGKFAQESLVDAVMLAPGERRVVEVLFANEGMYTLTHATPKKQYVLGKVTVSSDAIATSYAKEFSVLRKDATVTSEFADLQKNYGDKAPDKKVKIDIEMNGEMQSMMNQDGSGNSGGMHGAGAGGGHMMPDGSMMGGSMGMMGMGDDGETIEWEDSMAMMNQMSGGHGITWKLTDEATGKSNDAIDDWNFKVGDKIKIRIFNDPKSMHPMQHPIHFHGQRFMVFSTNGVRNTNPVWQDTALIPKGDTIDLILDVTNPGMWMAHCHIAEHAENGMMFHFKVD